MAIPSQRSLPSVSRGKEDRLSLEDTKKAIQEKISQLPKHGECQVVMKINLDGLYIEVKEGKAKQRANLLPPHRPIMEIIARELARLPYHLADINITTSEADSPAKPPVAPSRAVTPMQQPKPGVEALINKYAAHYGVDPKLVKALISKESEFNPNAVSPKGAKGLMQLMPATATKLGVKNPFDPEQNIAGGISYLRYCLDCFQNNVPFAVAAYNAGPNKVIKYRSIPPIRETQLFVKEVMQSYLGQSPAINNAAEKNLTPVSGRVRPTSSAVTNPTTKYIPDEIIITMIQVRPKKSTEKIY